MIRFGWSHFFSSGFALSFPCLTQKVDYESVGRRFESSWVRHFGQEIQGYKPIGTDALECFRQDPHRFDLVVADMTMPGMRGDRLAEKILRMRPDIPVILCTGYSERI